LEWFIKNYSIFRTMFAPYSDLVKSPNRRSHKEITMKALPIHPAPSSRATANQRAVLGVLGKVAIALLTALLLGLVMAYLPPVAGDWTLPTEPAQAAAFTA
jgi:hypothetical protein